MVGIEQDVYGQIEHLKNKVKLCQDGLKTRDDKIEKLELVVGQDSKKVLKMS